MKDDPVKWISEHKQAGIILREELPLMPTAAERDAWERRQLDWAQQAYDGVAARSPRDAARVKVLDKIPALHFLPDHPWADPAVTAEMTFTATGVGRPGNNPLAYHIRRIEVLQEIEREWRAARPMKPTLRRATAVDSEAVAAWYRDRAARAKEGDRSSREDDRAAAENHFNCAIKCELVEELRAGLPQDHPYRRRGRPPER